MRRAFATLLLAVMALVTGGPVTCAGWEPAAAERMSCCKRAGHDCPDQSAADDCCAQQEQSHQPGASAAAATLSTPVSIAAFFVATDYPGSAASLTASPLLPVPGLTLHDPPGFFAPPLRI